ncbi:hypothetical protein FOA52_000514 [Chlamydomonas sp. UWO 241]|nr:hypothetical protein FOA52_000514 [Chlamydomonas sp. UWO 241]
MTRRRRHGKRRYHTGGSHAVNGAAAAPSEQALTDATTGSIGLLAHGLSLSSFDTDTVVLVEAALEAKDVDRLRELAWDRGLVCSRLRQRAWPLLLGLHQKPNARASEDPLPPPPRPSPGPEPRQHSGDGSGGGSGGGGGASGSGAAAGASGEGEGAARMRGGWGGGSSGNHGIGDGHGFRDDDTHEADADSGSDRGGDRAAGGGGSRSSTRHPELCSPRAGHEHAYTEAEYERWHSAQHRDSQVVAVDVERSLWSFTPGMCDVDRQALRDQLGRMLNAVVGRYAGLDPRQHVFYFQGLHDVASVLLLGLGSEAAAFGPLCALVTRGLMRDCTRPGLEPVLQLLQLLWPLLSHADRNLAAQLRASGLPPYFALGWVLTWFSHDAKTLDHACRLFDAFLAAHPLAPLYLGVAAITLDGQLRRSLVEAGGEMPQLHAALAHIQLDAPGTPALRALLQDASRLMRSLPPGQLLARLAKEEHAPLTCVSPWANLVGGAWAVPLSPGTVPRATSGLQLLLTSIAPWLGQEGPGGIIGLVPGGSKPKRARPTPLVVLSVGGALSVYVVAVLMGYAATRASAGG